MGLYENWQIKNNKDIKIIFNIIVNNLKKNNIEILEENKLYIELVEYLFKTRIK